MRPYRKPTLVDRGKSPKAIERTTVKELGKLTPYLRKKGCPGRIRNYFESAGGRRKRPKRLFTKNTGPCQSES